MTHWKKILDEISTLIMINQVHQIEDDSISKIQENPLHCLTENDSAVQQRNTLPQKMCRCQIRWLKITKDPFEYDVRRDLICFF